LKIYNIDYKINSKNILPTFIMLTPSTIYTW